MHTAESDGASTAQGARRAWLSVVIPTRDEHDVLIDTVATLLEQNPADLCEVIVVTPQQRSPATQAAIDELTRRYGARVVPLHQKRPHYGGAALDGIEQARGSHVTVCDADGETDPSLVRRFVAELQRGQADIVSASRWLPGGGFAGYGRAKWLGNAVFQRLFARLYRTGLTDLTYGYRLYPRAMFQRIPFRDLRHSFALETLVKPLRLGYTVAEVPAVWRRRGEGRSTASLTILLEYVVTGLRVRFARLGPSQARARMPGEGEPPRR